jgi:hypothetical protein
MRIDLGLEGKANVGDRATFATKFKRVGPSIMSKAIDDRIGIVTLIELLKHAPEPLINPVEGFGVLWSAKSGSKAAKLWYFARVGLLGEAADYPEPGRPRPHQFQNEVVSNRPFYKEWLEKTDPSRLAWLRVIRDPYNRAISSYRHALRHGYEDSKIRHCLGLKIADRGLSFAEFLEYLLAIDIADCNLHHSQQWHMIEQCVALSKVVNLDKEQLLDALEVFERELGLAQLDPAIRERMLVEWGRDSRRYHKRLEAESGAHAETRFTREEAGDAWPGYEAFLSKDTRRKIERIYTKDFAAYADCL